MICDKAALLALSVFKGDTSLTRLAKVDAKVSSETKVRSFKSQLKDSNGNTVYRSGLIFYPYKN